MSEPHASLISEQAKGIEHDCDRGAIRDSLVSSWWNGVNSWLGGLAAGAAAIAAFLAGNGGAVFDDSPWGKAATAGAALISAILTSILTFLSPSKKASEYHQFSNKYRALRNRIRAFRGVECTEEADRTNLERQFDRILQQKSEIDTDHPVVPQWAFDQARYRWNVKEEMRRSSRSAEVQQKS